MSSLNLYIKKFSSLKVDRSKGEPAPHKPILLLSIIALIERGEIVENKICITSDLVAAFKDLWSALVTSTKFVANFSLPFFHLTSSKFWFLQAYPGRQLLLTSSLSIKSFKQLKDTIDFAYFDNCLFQLLMNNINRTALKQTLLATYFSRRPNNELLETPSLSKIITRQILEEPAAVYRTLVAQADEEELFVRSAIFKREIPKVYNYTCCITKMRVVSTYNVQMVDACHIVPFSVSNIDIVSNGISLCPNLHRAFDRFLITIDEQYKVVVADSFSELENNYSIKRHHGEKILLPNERNQMPDQNNLAWHRNEFYRRLRG